jgi:hypothetical protein
VEAEKVTSTDFMFSSARLSRYFFPRSSSIGRSQVIHQHLIALVPLGDLLLFVFHDRLALPFGEVGGAGLRAGDDALAFQQFPRNREEAKPLQFSNNQTKVMNET